MKDITISELYGVSEQRINLILNVMRERLEGAKRTDGALICVQIIKDLPLNDNEALLLGSFLQLVVSASHSAELIILRI
jgi:hypothetical protein